MSQPPPDPPDFLSSDWAWEAFRRDVFQLISWGYQEMEPEIRRRAKEEDITGLIRQGINRRLDDELPLRFSFYSAHNEDPVDDAGRFGKNRPRIDIAIECACRPVRKRYRLEAKRCATSSYPIRKYTEGIPPFLGGQYARDSPEAGMLGLVQTDTPAYWKSQLDSTLPTDSSLACVVLLDEVDLPTEVSIMSGSVHDRANGTQITLFHAFLDCA